MDESTDVYSHPSSVRSTTDISVPDERDNADPDRWFGSVMRRLLQVPRSTFIKGSILLLASTFIASAGSYLFNVIAGRALGPDSYGALAALVSLLYLMATPSLAMQTLAAREVARLRTIGGVSASNEAGRQFHRWALAVGFAVILFFALLSIPLNNIMRMGSFWPVAVIGVVGGASVVASTLRGILQGRGEFGRLALTMIADPVARLVTLIILLLLGFRFGAGLAAFVVSGACVYALSALLVRRDRGAGTEIFGETETDSDDTSRVTLRSVGPYVLIAGLTTVLYSVDVLVARSTLPEHEAGIYAAVSLLGRALYFVGAAASVVMLPLVTQRVTSGMDHWSVLLQSLGLVSVLSGLGLLAYLLVPQIVVRVTYGTAFEEVESNLFLMGAAMSMFAVAYIAINYLIALSHWGMLFAIVAVVVTQLVLLVMFHNGVRQIALVQLAVMALLNISVWPFVLRGRDNQGSLVAR